MSISPAYVCPKCDVLLWDGVHYAKCPACDSRIDAVDPAVPIWCCRTCDRMVNRAVDAPDCERCSKAMVPVFAGAPPGDSEIRLQRLFEKYIATPTGLTLVYVLSLLPFASMALHPVYRWFALGLAPLMVLPLIVGGSLVYYIGRGIPEIVAMARNRKLRVVHGFEHGTAHVLEKQGVPVLYGMSYEDGSFELAIARDDDGKPFPAEPVRKAVQQAIERIRGGETELAYHPRCGSTFIALLFIAGLSSLLVAAVALFLQVSPAVFAVLIGGIVAAILGGSRVLGRFIQRHYTVDTRFERARVARIVQSGSDDREVVYKVQVAIDADSKQTTQRVAAAKTTLAPASPVVPAPPLEVPSPAIVPPQVAEPKPMPGVRCPSCAWVPDHRDLWRCVCGWKWNTFSTRGECPACSHRFTETQCLSCRSMSAHEAWYATASDSGSKPPAAA